MNIIGSEISSIPLYKTVLPHRHLDLKGSSAALTHITFTTSGELFDTRGFRSVDCL